MCLERHPMYNKISSNDETEYIDLLVTLYTASSRAEYPHKRGILICNLSEVLDSQFDISRYHCLRASAIIKLSNATFKHHVALQRVYSGSDCYMLKTHFGYYRG